MKRPVAVHFRRRFPVNGLLPGRALHERPYDRGNYIVRFRRNLAVIAPLSAGASGTPPPTNRKVTLYEFATNRWLSHYILRRA